MSSTYSTNLAIELMGTGDQAGTWGTTTNTNLGTLIEQAISGYVTQAVATGTDTTITIPNGASGTARNMFIELTGTGGASTNLIVPNNKKLYFVYNNTSSGQVTVKVSGQTGVSVANGTKVILVSNGTDIVNATSYSTTTGTVTGSGTTNYVTKFTGSTAVGNSVIYDDGTNVGIGTSSPSYAVDIRNAASTALRVGSNSNAFGSLLSWDNSSGTGRLWTLGAYDFVFGVNSTEQMRLTSTGLGIGTSSPAYKLDVSGIGNFGGANPTLYIQPTTNTNNALLRCVNAGGTAYVGLDNNTAGLTANYSLNIYHSGAYPINFSTNGTLRATIDSSGNLGIGTSSPANKLYVAGGASTPVVAVTFSATAMTVNCQLSNTFSTTFTANVTTAPTISNPSDGQTINWFITQDGTGSRTMTWPTSFKWAGGTAGVLSTAANSVDLVVATYRSATGFWYVSLSKAFS